MRSHLCLLSLSLSSCSLLFSSSPNVPLDGGVADAQTNRDGPSKDGASADAQLVDSGPSPDANPGCTTRLAAVAWWRGEGDATDSAGNHDGMAMAGVGYEPGRVDMAFRFNGSTGISVPDASEAFRFAGPFSVEMWVKRATIAGAPPAEVFVGKDQCVTTLACMGSKWLFGLSEATSYPRLLLNPISDGETADLVVTTTAIIPMDQEFHHLVATYTGSAVTIYVDGDEKTTFDDIVPIGFANAESGLRFYIGGSASEGFNGWIDEVVYYNRALTDTEVAMLHLNDCSL